jgi:FkbM family methyltransferase
VYILTRHGGFLSVDPSNLDVFAVIYNAGGEWDSHVMKTCERVLRPGDVYYDIGSNSGVYSIVPALTVNAFEPQPSLAYHIRRSIEANGLQRVRCLEVLLGQKDGESVLHIPSHSMHALIVPREERSRELRLPMRTLDSLIMSKEIEAPDVIKIDAEGAETTVFEGARQTP